MSRKLARSAVLMGLMALLCLGDAASADAATFSNSSPITINDSANATPYPSAIAASGLGTSIADVDVTLNGFSHAYSDDVGIVLVAPSGAALLLMDGVGEGPATNATLTFDDSAAGQLAPKATPPATGTYKPTAYYTGDSFPAPGPLTVYGHPGPAGGNSATLASVFNGLNPNGTWNLFVRDFTGGDSGAIAGGWTLKISTTEDVPNPPVLSSTNPTSPAASLSPYVIGSADAGAAVTLYPTADCSGTKAASGTAAELASPGLRPTVLEATTTKFTATATVGPLTSACSAPISYTALSQKKVLPPAPPPVETSLGKSKINAVKDKAKFTFSASGGSGALSFECKLDKKPFKACTSPKKYSGLKVGKHTFEVRAKDSKGTVDPTPATRKFSIPKPK
jgi:subtilisin-like proprotein convertase family protein